ncbi:putative transposase domain protein [Brucella pseudogrignonensis]|uniref:Putative transposase domain protein n=1 Tax=Brucella pseudogrignonensis TaxID=419475 RepID=A0A256G8B0_9HYPH|nr:putative transposase domain protein [Brucella pseudogrignonensis]
MIDKTCVRVHQHGATGKRGQDDGCVAFSQVKSTQLLMQKAVRSIFE